MGKIALLRNHGGGQHPQKALAPVKKRKNPLMRVKITNFWEATGQSHDRDHELSLPVMRLSKVVAIPAHTISQFSPTSTASTDSYYNRRDSEPDAAVAT
jgi:hypothetical protein